MAWLSVSQFAERVGKTVQGIHYLIKSKDPRLKVDRFGYLHVVDEGCVKNFLGEQTKKSPRAKASNGGGSRVKAKLARPKTKKD